MQQDSDIRHGRHRIFKIHVHATRYRRRVIDAAAIDALRDIFQSVCRDIEAMLMEMDGDDGHVHLLVEYPLKVLVSPRSSTRSRASPAACCDNAARISANAIGAECSGPRPTSPSPAAEHPSPSAASTWSSRKPQMRPAAAASSCLAAAPSISGRNTGAFRATQGKWPGVKSSGGR